MVTKQLVKHELTPVRSALMGLSVGFAAVGVGLMTAAVLHEIPGPGQLPTTVWLLFVVGVVILGLATTRLLRSPRARAVGHLVALGMMGWATVQAWLVVGTALSWAGPDPATAMGFACLLGAGLGLAAATIPPAGQPRPRTRRAVVVPMVAGVVLAVACAGYGLLKVVPALSPVLSVTAEAPATVPGMPGPLPNDTVTGELVATFTSLELTGDVQVIPGARGPILSDDDTVIGIDGATGEQLWQYQLQNRDAHFESAGQLVEEGWDDRLVLSPDGTTVVFATCNLQQGVVTVLDGLTGRVSFVLPFSCAATRVSVTDHVVVVGRTAHDIHTGAQRWSAEDSRGFLPGTNGSSRLVVPGAPNPSRKEAVECGDCLGEPVLLVSDQDPDEVVAQLDRGVRKSSERQLRLYQGWALVHDFSDGSNRWVEIETLEAMQAPVGDPGIVGSYTGFPKCFGLSGPGQVLDSWSGRVWEDPEAGVSVGNDPLAENAWVLGQSGTKELTLISGDGEPLAPPIPLPAPEGESHGSGAWDIDRTVRTRDGGATLLRWKGESKEEQPVLLAIHR